MEELKKGQKLKIKFNISSIRSYEITCLIKGIEDDRINLIYPENDLCFAKYLHEGKEVEVVIYSDKGIYVFDSMVIDSPFSIDFVIEFPEEKTKVQRREYIRAPIRADFTLKKGEYSVNSETINIGGGGVRFLTDKEFKISDKWKFTLNLSNYNVLVSGIGEILYSIKQENKIVSVIKFSEIEESARNKIIKICFEEEANGLRTRSKMPNNIKGFV
ncbi:MAG: hypothetical protein A2104_09520 [Candidatus Melainabacteria bacterium GWF2_32_7]|nr:MAG: hypothetical protein A2104_09520 [Candidatus Melainabacteria bacterium GWF2_32_7]